MQISIWEKETYFAPQDVIIIGSGFVGLWSALFLKKKYPNKKITIIERGIIPSGASTRNAGFACFGSLSELIYDASTMGVDKMMQLVELRYTGLKRIQKFFKESEIDFDLCGGYELYEPGKIATEELHNNIDYLNTLMKSIIGKKQVFKPADEKIINYGFGKTQHLVKNNFEGYLHSGKLLQALLYKVQGMGVQVFTSTEIKEMVEKNDFIEIRTIQPFSFSTSQVLLCTNAFTKDLIPEIDITPARGQVLLTSPLKKLPFRGTFHSDEGFYYFRNLGNRVLLGGARNKAFQQEVTIDMNTSDFIQLELQDYLAEIVLPNFKDHYTIEHRWSGIMAMGSEKMPIVKQLSKNIFCAVRMSGMGVALAPIVSQQVAEMME